MTHANQILDLQIKLDQAIKGQEALCKMNTDLILGLLNAQEENKRLKQSLIDLSSR